MPIIPWTDTQAIDAIRELMDVPEWDVGLFNEIEHILCATGRNLRRWDDAIYYNLPSHWLPALVNGDYSDLSEQERDLIERFLASESLTTTSLELLSTGGFYCALHDAADLGVPPCECLEFVYFVPSENATA